MKIGDLRIEHLEEQSLWHLTGTSPQSLANAPRDWFTYFPGDALEFIARIGEHAWLILNAAEGSPGVPSGGHCFPRDDCLLVISGGDWHSLMHAICSFDFASAAPYDFVMTQAAGVSIWVRVPVESEPVLIGCDPSYGHYFTGVLQEAAADADATPISG